MDLFTINAVEPQDFAVRPDPAAAAQRLRSARDASDEPELAAAARRFEGLIIHQILKQMQETTAQLEPDEEEESEAAGSEHLKSMFWTFLGDVVTEQGGFGLWKDIYQQMVLSGPSEPPSAGPVLDERL